MLRPSNEEFTAQLECQELSENCQMNRQDYEITSNAMTARKPLDAEHTRVKALGSEGKTLNVFDISVDGDQHYHKLQLLKRSVGKNHQQNSCSFQVPGSS
ncbi:hypothetical protein MUK42_27887 [Musa troglodytarum]|uniref:Uncharacterized protein n=1 Tax=Musa troglodytarum TaxID=320322 RepID=A0A9E7F1B5_9LILI|nr:hypothetical protein MUK42_27887 [Musa troglodytarum]